MKRARSAIDVEDVVPSYPQMGSMDPSPLPPYKQLLGSGVDLMASRGHMEAQRAPSAAKMSEKQANEPPPSSTAADVAAIALATRGMKPGIDQRSELEGKSEFGVRGSKPMAEQKSENEGKMGLASKSLIKEEEIGPEQSVIHRVMAGLEKISLREIASGPIDIIADAMNSLVRETQEQLKAELREILNGSGGSSQREEFVALQNLVLARRDLSPESLLRANRNQLQILVALKTGIQAFLHPDISATQTVLIEVFFHKRCRNMACQNQLSGDDCRCEICTTRSGFCNVCMCTICSKFDFDVNTCRWIGCDVCAHWAHTDCALKVHQIGMGTSLKGSSEMLFTCRACKHTSELLGWVRDVFQTCAADWNADELMKEFDSVRRIFHGAEDAKGKRLFWKSGELLERLKNGTDSGSLCNEMQRFFEDLEAEEAERYKGEDAKKMMMMIEPQEACNRIVDVVQEAVAKMEMVAQEKTRALKRARAALEASDKELEEKKRELQELQIDRLRKKQEIEELETIVKLRLAESEMFQMRADDARSDAEKLQRIVADRSEKAEEEYTARYLQIRLNEVEAERQALFEKIHLQEQLSRSASSQQPNAASQIGMRGKIEDLLKRVVAHNPKEAADPKDAINPKT